MPGGWCGTAVNQKTEAPDRQEQKLKALEFRVEVMFICPFMVMDNHSLDVQVIRN